MNFKNTKEGLFFVDIIEPSKEEIDNYYVTTGEFKVSSKSEDSPRIFKKAVIKVTFDEKNFPVNSLWMMGESPGLKVNFFGDKITVIQEKDLYGRIS